MKKLMLIAIIFLIAAPVFSQTPEEIRKEAYPDQTQTTDNSDYAKLLGKLTDAKKSGDQKAFNGYLNELNIKYGNKGNVSINNRLPDNRTFFLPTMNQPVETGNLPDWANGENIIYQGTVGTSSSGNPRAFNRTVKIETDNSKPVTKDFTVE